MPTVSGVWARWYTMSSSKSPLWWFVVLWERGTNSVGPAAESSQASSKAIIILIIFALPCSAVSCLESACQPWAGAPGVLRTTPQKASRQSAPSVASATARHLARSSLAKAANGAGTS